MALKDRPANRKVRLIALLVILVAGLSLVFQSSEFWKLVARIQWSLGFTEGAIRTLRSHDFAPDGELLLARFLVDSGQYAEGLKTYQRVGFDDHVDLERIGHCMTMLGRWTESVPTLQSAASKHPLSIPALCDLADSCACLGMYSEARAAADLLRKSSRPVAGFYRLGLMEFEQSRFESCIDSWSRILDQEIHTGDLPVSEERLWLTFVSVCLLQGKRDEADRGLSRLPDSARKSLLQGNLAELDGKSEDARLAWEVALQKDASLTDARIALARHRVRTGSFRNAIDILKPMTSSEENATSLELCGLLHSAYAGIGETESAERWKSRQNQLLSRESERDRLNQRASNPSTVEFRVLRAWKLASMGNRHQAELMIQPIVEEVSGSDGKSPSKVVLSEYIRELSDAIKSARPLPDPYDFLVGRADSEKQ